MFLYVHERGLNIVRRTSQHTTAISEPNSFSLTSHELHLSRSSPRLVPDIKPKMLTNERDRARNKSFSSLLFVGDFDPTDPKSAVSLAQGRISDIVLSPKAGLEELKGEMRR